MSKREFSDLLRDVASAPPLLRRGKLVPSESAGSLGSDEDTVDETIPLPGTPREPSEAPSSLPAAPAVPNPAPTVPPSPSPDALPFPPAEEEAAPPSPKGEAVAGAAPPIAYKPKPLVARQNTLIAPPDYWSRMASAETQALAEEAAIGGELERLRTRLRFAAAKVRGVRRKLVLLTPQSPRETKLLLQALAMLKEALGSAEQSDGDNAGDKAPSGDSGGTGTKGSEADR